MENLVRELLIDDIKILFSDIRTALKDLKICPNLLHIDGALYFTRNEVTSLRKVVKDLDANQYGTNFWFTVGSSLGIVGGLSSIMWGVGIPLSVLGGVVNIFSTSNRKETQTSLLASVSHTVQKFCLIPDLLENTLTCFVFFCSQEAQLESVKKIGQLNISTLRDIRDQAALIRNEISGTDHKATIQMLTNISATVRALVNGIFENPPGWIDFDDDEDVKNAIAIVYDFALENKMKSLRQIVAAMVVSKVAGCTVLGLCTSYAASQTIVGSNCIQELDVANKLANTGKAEKTVDAVCAATADNAAGPANAAEVSTATKATQTTAANASGTTKFVKIMNTAFVLLQVVGIVSDAVLLGRAVSNVIGESPSEHSKHLNYMADIIEMLINCAE